MIEYGTNGIVSKSGDVYSYGITLLEMFTGKKPTDEVFEGEMNLKVMVSQCIDCNSIMEVVDSNMMREGDEHFAIKAECVLSICGLAMACLEDSPQQRISAKEIVSKLQQLRTSYLANGS